MQLNAEALTDPFRCILHERLHFRGPRVACIHEEVGMFLGDRGVPDTLSTHADLVDIPPGRSCRRVLEYRSGIAARRLRYLALRVKLGNSLHDLVGAPAPEAHLNGKDHAIAE